MIEPSYHTEHRPIRDVQVETLNQALNDEVLRHARTRLQLLQLLQFCWVKEALPRVEVIRKAIVRRVEFEIQTVEVPVVRRHLPVIDAALKTQQDTVLSILPACLKLRSGAVLDTAMRSVSYQGGTAIFADSAWLALALMAQRSPEYANRHELKALLFGEQGAYSSVRAAVGRARATLESTGAQGDITTDRGQNGGWGLLLARKGRP